MKKALFLLCGLSTSLFAQESNIDWDIARKLFQQEYKNSFIGEETGEVFYLDSQVKIDDHHFYIRVDGMGSKGVHVVSCKKDARFMVLISTEYDKQIDDFSYPVAGFSPEDLKEFVRSFAENKDLAKLCKNHK